MPDSLASSLNAARQKPARSAMWAATNTRQSPYAIFEPGSAYYHTQAFSVTENINPLVAAASPLFSILPKLQFNPVPHDIAPLWQHLIHEIKAFEQQATHNHCSTQAIILARYSLCITFDHLLRFERQKIQPAWPNQSLVQHFQAEEDCDDKFWLMIARLLEQHDAASVDLLEFIYLCINLGWLDTFTGTLYPKEAIHLSDKLYQMIRNHRGPITQLNSRWQAPNIEPNLHPVTATTTILPPKQHFWTHRIFYLTLATCSLIALLYLGFDYLLANLSHALYSSTL